MATSNIETVTPRIAPKQAGRPRKIGQITLLLGLVAMALWVGFAPLDEGVPSQGFVALDTKRKAVQHLTGGLIKEVMVGEGSQVKEGQLLMRLDDANIKAEHEMARQRYFGIKAMQARLLAEQTGSNIQFSKDLLDESKDPLIKSQMLNQELLLQSRQSALRSDLQGLEESMQGQMGQLQAYKDMLVNRQSQQSLVQEQLNRIRDLVKEGYAPRNTQLDLERQLAEAHAAIADLQGLQIRTARSVAELKQRASSRQQEYKKEVQSQLADVSRELPGDLEKMIAMQEALARVDIRSPASGQVVGLITQNVGAIVASGQKIMDIVPVNENLTLEIRVMPNLIDRVKADLPVDVRFTAFSHSPQLVVQGKVISVSGDLLTDPHSGAPYFLARVAVTPEGLKKLGKNQLQPGLPVEVVFKTGERSLLTYLMHPLTKRIAASMKEE